MGAAFGVGRGGPCLSFFSNMSQRVERRKNNDKDGWWDQGEGKQQETNLD